MSLAPLPDIADLCRWIVEGGPSGSLRTEFLGDLYQAHCEEARKGRALVQTPAFVRELILDRTLGEVLRKWGPMAAKTIDPTCGCGHFLVDAFRRTFAAWMALERATLVAILDRTGGFNPADPIEAVVAQIALDQVVGVDLDPVCVAISRVRLLFEAWASSDVRMRYRIGVFEGDALLHHRPMPDDDGEFGPWPYDVAAVRRALRPGQYTAVVGNPPYITAKDARLREAYRRRYPTCHGQYSLAVPFTEVFFGLTRRDDEPAVVRERQGTLFVDRGEGDAPFAPAGLEAS